MAKAFVAIAVLLIVGLVGVGLLYEPSPDRSLVINARKAWVNGDAEEASKLIDQHLQANPADDAARLEWVRLISDADPDRAFELLEEIPDDAEAGLKAANELGRLGLEYGDNERAETGLLRMTASDPELHGPVLALAELYFKTSRFQEALPMAEKAAQLNPGRAQTWVLVADCLDRLGRPGELLEPLRKAVEAEPNSYVARGNLAFALQAAAELDEAKENAEWCLERNPADISMLRILAKIQTDLGETDPALVTIRKATAIAPNDAQARIIEADLLLFKKDAQSAYDLLIPLYDAHSQRREYLNILARAAVKIGKRDEARQYLKRVQELMDATDRSAGTSDQPQGKPTPPSKAG